MQNQSFTIPAPSGPLANLARAKTARKEWALDLLTWDQFNHWLDDKRANYGPENDAEWYGETLADARAKFRHGDKTSVTRAESLTGQFSDVLDMETLRREYMPNVTGVLPLVPAYLAGTPENMLCPVDVESAQGEVVLAVDLFISASFSVEAGLRRGAAVLALAQYLATKRPVRLVAFYAVTGGNDRHAKGFAVDIPCTPFDLARASFILANPAMLRRFGHGRLFATWGDIMTQTGRTGITEPETLEGLCQLFGADAALVTPDLVSGDGAAPFKSDKGAAAWVESMATKALAML